LRGYEPGIVVLAYDRISNPATPQTRRSDLPGAGKADGTTLATGGIGDRLQHTAATVPPDRHGGRSNYCPPTAYQTVPTPAPDEPLDDPWRGDLVSVHGGRANRPPPARRTDTETVRVMVACRRHGCASQMSQDAVDKSAHNWFTQS
jgi:hypothetical protein